MESRAEEREPDGTTGVDVMPLPDVHSVRNAAELWKATLARVVPAVVVLKVVRSPGLCFHD